MSPESPPQGIAPKLGTIALAVGVAALVSSLVPVVSEFGSMLAELAMLLGLAAKLMGCPRGSAITAMVLGGLASSMGLVILLASGGFAELDRALVEMEVTEMSVLLDEDEFADDDCLSVDFDQPAGNSVDYTVSNACDHTTPAAVFVVDAFDGNGNVIASGWGDAESLDTSGHSSTYASYAEFDDDLTRAASFEIRDLDADNSLAETWWNRGYEATES